MSISRTSILPILFLISMSGICSAGLFFLVGQGVFQDAMLLSQKNEELENLKLQEKYVKEFQETQRSFSSDIQSLDTLFIDPNNPIEFLEFLERTAQEFGLVVDVAPNAPVKLPLDVWRSMNFTISSQGAYGPSMRFLEALDHAPYLLEVKDVSIAVRKGTVEANILDLSISVKVYVK